MRGWVTAAACAGRDPTLWDLKPNNDKSLSEENRLAMRVCLGCPVRRPCLDEAISQATTSVIRGGYRFGGDKTSTGICPRCAEVFPRTQGRTYCSSRCRDAASEARRKVRAA